MNKFTPYQRLKRRIDKLFGEIHELRKNCKHPNAIGTYIVDMATLAEVEDKHWLGVECPDCGDRWCIANTDPDYLTFGRTLNHKIKSP